MPWRGVQRREGQRKRIALEPAVGRSDKWHREQGWPWAGVAQAVRRLRLIDRDSVALDHRIVDPVASADTRLLRSARDFRQSPVVRTRRVSHPYARREAIARWHQSARHAFVAWVDKSKGRGRVDH